MQITRLLPLALLAFASPSHAAVPDTYRVGVAQVDITPGYAVRLSGFGFRRAESEGVTQKIWAKALVIDDGDPAVIVTIDSCIIPFELTDELAKRLEKKVGRDRLAVTITHTHTAPMIKGTVPTLFGVPIPKEHQERIDRYSAELLDKLEQVVLAALEDRKPAKLTWGIGSAGFAINRRTSGGPIDHDLPVLVVKDMQGKVRAILTSYACHCVTLSNNKVSGDWAGYAQEAIQDEFPGSIALVAIGCAADQNPNSGVTGDKAEVAQRQGMEIAKEVKRLASNFLAPVSGRLTCATDQFELPLAALPTKEDWEVKSKRTDAIGHHARVQLDRLARGEALKTEIPYRVQTITFGDSLAMVFLPGEVVVDYSLRLKKELDRSRLWINAYANACPCYIPSERVLKEGGYEGGGAMTYYDLPAHLKSGLEQKIVEKVHAQIGRRFTAPIDPKKAGESRPLSPQQSLKAIQVHKDLAVELVVAEPLVTSPVAIDWGADGKLYVAEMFDYPEGVRGDFQPGGRVKVLEDIDGDWRYDKATVFLDNIPFPTGVTAWRKGVLVCAAPDILYAEDTDGDGKADVVKKLFSGFGTHNYQGRVNSLEHGLDGWVYGSCGLFGGKITCRPLFPDRGKEAVVNLGDRDFRIKPDEGILEPATGRTQQGRVRDDWGNWFGCDSGTLCRHYPLMDHYLRRNPHYAATDTVVHVPRSQKLFPLNPQLQLFKLSGPAGVPTAACGLGIYRDDRLGTEFTGNAFICEPVNLLVHRMKLEPKGSTFTGVRAAEEQDREFLASTDTWFRPVQARTGPDGCLWIVDMYRYVIEHPRWIPPEELAKLDLRAGSNMGRIYRVRAKDREPRPMFAAINSGNGWQRDMAMHQLLSGWASRSAEQRKAALEILERMSQNTHPQTRVQVLCALRELHELKPKHLQMALGDPHPGVRRQAIRLCEPSAGTPLPFPAELAKLVDDADHQVRLQLACTLGQWNEESAARLLAKLAVKHSGDPHLVSAALSSIRAENLDQVIAAVVAEKPPPDAPLRPLIRMAVSMQNQAALARMLAPATKRRHSHESWLYQPWQLAALATLFDAIERRGQNIESFLQGDSLAWVRAATAAARELLNTLGGAGPDPEILALLGHEPRFRERDIQMLSKFIQAKHGMEVQTVALKALSRTPDDQVAAALLAAWKTCSPAVKPQILDLVLSRLSWQKQLLESIAEGELPAGQIDATRRQRLLNSKDETIRATAARLFEGAGNPDRQKVLAAFADAAQLPGDKSRGKQVFTRTCATCHRLDNVGHDIGPDLRALGGKTPQFFLQEILDPSRNLDTRYVEYVVLTKAGRTITGLLAAETATSITLRGQEGKQEVLLRSEIDELQSSGKSLMPEGLEKDLSKQDLADVIAFVMAANAPGASVAAPKQFAGNRPQLVRAVDGQLSLLATNADIVGSEIMFEEALKNIGMWHGEGDRASWTIELAKAEVFDVWLEWSCDDGSANNPYVLESGKATLRGRVDGTGGWDRYRQAKIGTLALDAGQQRLTLRPDGVKPQWALMDLRGVYLVPKGAKPVLQAKEAGVDAGASSEEIAKQILDDKLPAEKRQELIKQHAKLSAELIKHMGTGIGDPKEEYRRIPWIWRVSIAAGRRNVATELVKILEVSLPKENEPLRDWQAVVIGGGVINGISLQGQWPGKRMNELLKEHAELNRRWLAILPPAAAMADNEKTPTGTRYDALRIIPLDSWEKCGERLAKYLAKGTHDELTMGAISGLSDVERPEVAGLLLKHIEHFSAGNRKLALEALLRTEERALEFVGAIEKNLVKKEWLAAEHVKALREHKDEKIRERARKVLGG